MTAPDDPHDPNRQAHDESADDEHDPQLQREARHSRKTGGDAPAAGSIAEREAVAQGGGAFDDDDQAPTDDDGRADPDDDGGKAR